MNPGEKVTVDIEKINSEGEGIARIGESGFVVFVPFALPGERVACEIVRSSKKYAAAKVLQVLTPSKERVAPRCSVYGKCGGCQLQHVNYPTQLAMKAEILRDALSRIGGFDGVEGIVCRPSPSEWRYRSKTSLPVSKRGEGAFAWGYYAQRSHHVVPFETCPVLEEKIEAVVKNAAHILRQKKIEGYDERKSTGNLRFIVARSGRGGDALLGLVTARECTHRELGAMQSMAGDMLAADASLCGVVLNLNPSSGNFVWGPRFRTLSGKNFIHESMMGYDFALDISSFFQINRAQAEDLFSYAAEETLADAPKNILELYSGVGSLTAPLAARAEKVVAVEEWRPAAKYLDENMKRNGFSNVEVVMERAERAIEAACGRERFDAVALDPPRGGCERAVVDGIVGAGIERVVYVSCNPATLARDLRIFADGGYHVEAIEAFDMFPQTAHVESVATLARS